MTAGKSGTDLGFVLQDKAAAAAFVVSAPEKGLLSFWPDRPAGDRMMNDVAHCVIERETGTSCVGRHGSATYSSKSRNEGRPPNCPILTVARQPTASPADTTKFP